MGKHSASVCEFEGRLYLAYYEAEHEGWKQSVIVLSREDGESWEVVHKLHNGYGNPVIFAHNDMLLLACSRFREEVRESIIAKALWAHTDLLLYRIDGAKPKLLDRYPYCGARCAPIVTDGKDDAILPAYDEMGRVCLLLKLDAKCTSKNINNVGLELNRGLVFSHAKIPMIQPSTIRQKGGNWTTYGRNFAYGYNPQCPPLTPVVAFSEETHKFVQGMSDLPNHNESVLLFLNKLDSDEPYVIYNAEERRQGLMLACVDSDKGRGKLPLNAIPGQSQPQPNHGSYPNCGYFNGFLVVCFTAYNQPGFKDQWIRLVMLEGNREGVMEVISVEDVTKSY